MENQEEKEMFKCWICKEAEFDSKQKLSVHQTHCKLKHPNYRERTERVPFGQPVQRFTISKEDRKKYHYHIFNDNWKKDPGRIQRALAAGYEVVEHDRSRESVGTNEDSTEIKGILMRLPTELYEEDQAAKQKKIDEIDNQIYRGKLEQAANDNRYLPGGGIRTEVKSTG